MKLGPPHECQVEGETRLVFTEEKNKDRKPKHRNIRMLPALRTELDTSPSGHLVYLVTKWGRPYASPKVFNNRFKAWCVQAGLPHRSFHGLRKAGARFAAENGATPHDLKSISGWKTLRQAEVYTRKVDEKRLGDQAVHLVDPDYKANESVPPERVAASGGTIEGKKP